ncbi:cation:proton antiporter [Candidatus Nanohalococcus occultus]|uniref:cation:proton antiporter n=1 Tax=Candidatus Nanohalococcus occultus TaxID=2978047 RepID=UPI0039DFFA46
MAAGLSVTTLFAISAVLAVSFVIGELFERIGLESIIGYIFAGLLLGPGLSEAAKIFTFIDPGWAISAEALAGFGTIGSTLILFQAGLREENAVDIFRHRKGLDLGLGVLIGSFTFILGALLLFGEQFLPFSGIQQFIFIALAYAMIDIGVPSKIMLSRGMLDRELGKYTIKASVINVTAGFGLLTVLVLTTASTLQSLAIQIAGILGFAAVFFVLHNFIHKIDDYIIMFEEAEAQFAITFALLLSMAYVTELIGLSSVVGAFFAGVIVSRSEFSESRAFQEKIKAISLGLFIPLFFAWFGLGLTITGPNGMLANMEAALFLFGLSTVSKLAIGYVIPKIHEFDSPFTVAGSLLSLDIETLVVLLIGIDIGIFQSSQVLQIFAPAVLFTTITIVGIYAGLDKLRE